MFYRPQHLQIYAVLQQLNSAIFHKNFAYFGGGTLISLTNDEYRQSNDIDFICSVQSSGYKQLRTQIFDHGYSILFQQSAEITIGRATTDQYGIRLLVEINSTPIKLEIIAEARFPTGKPQQLPWLSLPCLNQEDLWTSKLLANADRFMDKSVLSRDLIDLAVLRLSSPIPTTSLQTAEAAYEIIRPLKKAIIQFQDQADYREKCWDNLLINESYIPKIIDGLDLFANDFGLSKTERTFKEHPSLY